MKLVVLLPLTVVVSVILMGLVKLRGKETVKEEKRNRFLDIKLRVTLDVVEEYQREIAKIQSQRDTSKTEMKTLDQQIKNLQFALHNKKNEVDACQGAKKILSDELASDSAQVSNLKAAEFKQQKTSWETEVASLKQKITQRSKVCDFVKIDSAVHRKLCGDGVAVKAPKQEEAKVEAPKQEEAKAEAPKQDDAKAEAPKQDDAKAEAPKQDDAKAKAPKQEEAKAEAPKQEDAKAEAPKQEDAKAEAPKRR